MVGADVYVSEALAMKGMSKLQYLIYQVTGETVVICKLIQPQQLTYNPNHFSHLWKSQVAIKQLPLRVSVILNGK